MQKEAKSISDKNGELPAELDFFKYAAAGPSKRNPSESEAEGHAKKKRRKRENSIEHGEDLNVKDHDDGASDVGSEQGTTPPMPKHRVTAKGKNVPERINAFKELQDRYHIASQLMVNLERNGYRYPTGIQSSGCPILLEVGPRLLRYSIELTAAVPRPSCHIPHGHRQDSVLPAPNHGPTPSTDIKFQDRRWGWHTCDCSGTNA